MSVSLAPCRVLRGCGTIAHPIAALTMSAVLVGWYVPVIPAQSPGAVTPRATSSQETPEAEPVDFDRARQLLQKRQRGERLTAEQQAYLDRARALREQANSGPAATTLVPRETTGLKPLTEMSAADRYQGEDGGLYGQGRNQPPLEHRRLAEAELARIQPLDASGAVASDGRIVFVSLSMSNATQEFSRFKQLADADARKSPKLTIVDCAQGGQAMAQWAPPQAAPWREAELRLTQAQVTPAQVQIAWVKLANKAPRGALQDHGMALKRDTLAVIHNAKQRFPNLRVIYLSSRIYGGYAKSPLNPEPYAYESAWVARWLIQDQIVHHSQVLYDRLL